MLRLFVVKDRAASNLVWFYGRIRIDDNLSTFAIALHESCMSTVIAITTRYVRFIQNVQVYAVEGENGIFEASPARSGEDVLRGYTAVYVGSGELFALPCRCTSRCVNLRGYGVVQPKHRPVRSSDRDCAPRRRTVDIARGCLWSDESRYGREVAVEDERSPTVRRGEKQRLVRRTAVRSLTGA